MNNLLNGTGWGELPEKELNIPYWMTPEWQRTERRILEAEEARYAAEGAKIRRKQRERARIERELSISLLVWTTLLILIPVLVGVIEYM